MNIGEAIILIAIVVAISMGLNKLDKDVKTALDDIANSVHAISQCGVKP